MFREDQEKYEERDSSLLLHSFINILCSAHEVSIEVETDDNRKVYAVSRTDRFAGVDYSLDEIRKFQEEDPDLELVLQFLRLIRVRQRKNSLLVARLLRSYG